MQVKKINYSEYIGEPREWLLKDFSLRKINLIVGRNTVGKTRTINVLSALAKLLSEDKKISFSDGKYGVDFDDDGKLINYILHYHDRNIVEEKLTIDGKVYLDRGNDGTGTLIFSEQNKRLKFQTPKDEIAVSARRDSIQHPFLNSLNEWGENLTTFRFGKTMGHDIFFLMDENVSPNVNVKETEKAAAVFVTGRERFGIKFTEQVISDWNQMGYEVDNIDIDSPRDVVLQSNIPIEFSGRLGGPIGLIAQEVDLKSPTFQNHMSQGMFRSLSLIIQLNYILMANQKGTILIDDIGEGIDFDRASALIQLLIDKINSSEFQLIMTTNDRFTMNKVPIEYWSILNRVGGTVYSYNYENSKEIFDDFKMTGLNNFDLFSSNYYLIGNGK